MLSRQANIMIIDLFSLITILSNFEIPPSLILRPIIDLNQKMINGLMKWKSWRPILTRCTYGARRGMIKSSPWITLTFKRKKACSIKDLSYPTEWASFTVCTIFNAPSKTLGASEETKFCCNALLTKANNLYLHNRVSTTISSLT